MADWLGNFNTASSRTTVRFAFSTHAATGAPVAPSSAFENADLLLYKDGGATQRTSASGITMTSPFDSVTGLHFVTIDLTDNTDAGFYAAGSHYTVVLSSDETVDSLAVLKVLAYFEIGPPQSNVVQVSGTTQTAGDLAALINTVDDLIDTEIATIAGYLDTEIAAIKAKTDNLPSDPADASDIAASFSTVNSTLSTIAGYIDTEVAAILAAVDTEVGAIKAKTDNLPSDPADASDIASSFSTVNSTLSTIAGYIDTEVASILAAVDTEVGAIKTVTDNLASAANIADVVWDEAIAGHASAGSTGAALSAATAPSASAVADAVWDEVLSGHLTAGSTGDALNSAGGGGSTLYGEDGSVTFTYTVYDTNGSTPLAGCTVYVSSDVNGVYRSQTKLTDSLGRVVFDLDPGTVYFFRTYPGRTFVNPDVENVS